MERFRYRLSILNYIIKEVNKMNLLYGSALSDGELLAQHYFEKRVKLEEGKLKAIDTKSIEKIVTDFESRSFLNRWLASSEDSVRYESAKRYLNIK